VHQHIGWFFICRCGHIPHIAIQPILAQLVFLSSQIGASWCGWFFPLAREKNDPCFCLPPCYHIFPQ
jgi:hypothetical protein